MYPTSRPRPGRDITGNILNAGSGTPTGAGAAMRYCTTSSLSQQPIHQSSPAVKQPLRMPLISFENYATSALRTIKELRDEVSSFCEYLAGFESPLFRSTDASNEQQSDDSAEEKFLAFGRATEKHYNRLEELVTSVDRRPLPATFHPLQHEMFDIAMPSDGDFSDDKENCYSYVEQQDVHQQILSMYIDRLSTFGRCLMRPRLGRPARPLNTEAEYIGAQFLAVLDELQARRGHSIYLVDFNKMSYTETVFEIQVGGEWLEEKCFVGAHMKAVLMFTYAEFSGIRIGAANETLWTEDADLFSKYEVFRKINNALSELLLTKCGLLKIRNVDVLQAVVGLVRDYSACFVTPCARCKKVMRDFLPPTMMLSPSRPAAAAGHVSGAGGPAPVAATFIHEVCKL